MVFTCRLKSAVKGVSIHKSRSALTILGIVIGIAAIMVIVSLGEGAQELILGEVRAMGSKTIAVVPGRSPHGITSIMSTFTDSLKEKDMKMLERKENVPHLEKIMPIVFGSRVMYYGTETYQATILGATGLFAQMYDAYPEKGRLFYDYETKSYANVVIIGSKIKDELFGNQEALNKKIRINNRNFKVIGVLPKKGQASFLNFDDMAIMPYTSAQKYVLGIKYFNRLVIEADEEKNVPQTVEDIKTTLRNSHNITDPEKDDFFIETQASAMKMISTITDILTLFLAAIATISLIVGGIGIMNIMFVSITERIKEIGLRKAVGATKNDILIQFLLESVILTFTGGIIGIIAGTAFSFAASIALTNIANLKWAFVFPAKAALIGAGVSILVGLIFGIYPAKQAAKLTPVDALKYE